MGSKAKLIDLDNDGWLDLFVYNDGVSLLDTLVGLSGGKSQPAWQVLRNKGGHFETINSIDGSLNTWPIRQIAVGDMNGDGWQDIYLISKDDRLPSLSLLNYQGSRFQPSFLGSLQGVRSAELIDIDGDGKFDILGCGSTESGNAFGATAVRLNSNSLLTAARVQLFQDINERSISGTHITVHVESDSGPFFLCRDIGVDPSSGGTTQSATIGLGTATKINELVAIWPEGLRQTWKELPVNSVIQLRRGRPNAFISPFCAANVETLLSMNEEQDESDLDVDTLSPQMQSEGKDSPTSPPDQNAWQLRVTSPDRGTMHSVANDPKVKRIEFPKNQTNQTWDDSRKIRG